MFMSHDLLINKTTIDKLRRVFTALVFQYCAFRMCEALTELIAAKTN